VGVLCLIVIIVKRNDLKLAKYGRNM
jgi:hypothetical protein